MPDGIEQHRLRLGRRVQVVGLEKLRTGGDAVEQEVDERGLLFLGDGRERLVELRRVGAVVGRQALADDEVIERSVVAEAIAKYGIDINKPNPMTV